MFTFWWSAEWSGQKMLTEMQKNKKGPLSHWKIKCLFFWLCSTSDDWLSNPGKKCWPKHKKMKKAPCHWKIKCSFLDYVYILMIGWVIWAKMLTERQKNKKGPLSHWKIKCSFLDYVQLLMIGWAIRAKNVDWKAKKWKRPPRSSKNKMLLFGLCSTSDDRLSNPGKKCWLKCKKTKKAP